MPELLLVRELLLLGLMLLVHNVGFPRFLLLVQLVYEALLIPVLLETPPELMVGLVLPPPPPLLLLLFVVEETRRRLLCGGSEALPPALWQDGDDEPMFEAGEEEDVLL